MAKRTTPAHAIESDATRMTLGECAIMSFGVGVTVCTVFTIIVFILGHVLS
jgi:hypothetical protein